MIILAMLREIGNSHNGKDEVSILHKENKRKDERNETLQKELVKIRKSLEDFKVRYSL